MHFYDTQDCLGGRYFRLNKRSEKGVESGVFRGSKIRDIPQTQTERPITKNEFWSLGGLTTGPSKVKDRGVNPWLQFPCRS